MPELRCSEVETALYDASIRIGGFLREAANNHRKKAEAHLGLAKQIEAAVEQEKARALGAIGRAHGVASIPPDAHSWRERQRLVLLWGTTEPTAAEEPERFSVLDLD